MREGGDKGTSSHNCCLTGLSAGTRMASDHTARDRAEMSKTLKGWKRWGQSIHLGKKLFKSSSQVHKCDKR